MKVDKQEMPAPAKESTYSMLVGCNEKKRGYSETILYALIMISAIVAILQFSLQPNSIPLPILPQ